MTHMFQWSMRIPQQLPQFEDKAFIIVSAKERGVVYLAHRGEISRLKQVEEHPPTYSDNEGFFFGGGRNRNRPTGGAPKEADKEYNLDRYFAKLSSEVNVLLKQHVPETVYVFEPSYLAGRIQEYVSNPTHIPFELVRTGNFVNEHPLTFVEFIQFYLDDGLAPEDPDSVQTEPRSEEKRKILETGR